MNVSLVSKPAAGSRLGQILIPLLVSTLGTAVVLFPGNPNNLTLPSRDSGVFLYMGWRFLSGDIPYRDVWDHKPPLIYFVDALGIALTPESLWGVWILQFIFIFLTLLLTYKLLDRELGFYPALAGATVLASGILTILGKGNVTEEYALPFQALGLLLFMNAWKKDFPVRDSFWMGLIAGLAFNFKQTTIGIWVTYGLFLIAIRFFQRRLPFRDLLALLAGWFIPSLVFVLYFASQHALSDFWEQAYLYNFVYIGKHEGLRRLVPVFIKGFTYLRSGGVLYVTVLGWLAGAAYVWLRRKSPADVHPLVLIALVTLPIEALLVLVSGRSILHYYLTPLPIMGTLAGVLVYTVGSLIRNVPALASRNAQKWIPAVLVIVIWLGQYDQVQYFPEYMRVMGDNDYAPVIEYVAANTTAEDKLLLIGAESVVNFLTRREAPTRYVYQYPLALLGRRPMFEEYFNQILRDKPALIVDTRGRSRLDEKLYTPLQKRSQIVREGVQYLGEHYRQVAQFGDWFVYRYAGE